MSNSLYYRLLAPGSFVFPIVTDAEIDSVIALTNKAGNRPLLSITKEMSTLSFKILEQYTKNQKATKVDPFKVSSISIGFRTPLMIIYHSYPQSIPLFNFSLLPRPTDTYTQRVIQRFKKLIVECRNEDIPTLATDLFTYCEENPYLPDDEFYKIGVIASLTTFREFQTNIIFGRTRK